MHDNWEGAFWGNKAKKPFFCSLGEVFFLKVVLKYIPIIVQLWDCDTCCELNNMHIQ